MGMFISAKLIYGVPYEDIPEDITDDVDEMLDNGELDYASPTYDAPRDEWIVGASVRTDGCDLNDLGERLAFETEYTEGLELIQQHCDLGFYVTPHVW